MDGTILVADDDRTIRTVLTQALTRAGCKVHATSSLMTLMRWVEEGKGDLVISDVIMPDGNGLQALPQIARDAPRPAGHRDFRAKHHHDGNSGRRGRGVRLSAQALDLPDLMKRSARALEIKRRAPKVEEVVPAQQSEDLPLVGRNRNGCWYRLVARVMNVDLPVLITGESGTGKSLIARAIHDFSDRRGQPLWWRRRRTLPGLTASPPCWPGPRAAVWCWTRWPISMMTPRPVWCGCWM